MEFMQLLKRWLLVSNENDVGLQNHLCHGASSLRVFFHITNSVIDVLIDHVALFGGYAKES